MSKELAANFKKEAMNDKEAKKSIELISKILANAASPQGFMISKELMQEISKKKRNFY